MKKFQLDSFNGLGDGTLGRMDWRTHRLTANGKTIFRKRGDNYNSLRSECRHTMSPAEKANQFLCVSLCLAWFPVEANVLQNVQHTSCIAHYHDIYISPWQGETKSWGLFLFYSLDKIQLLRIMPSCISQLEFPVVSGQHDISKYRSLVHMSSYIGTFFMWNQISAFIFTWPEKLIRFLSAIYMSSRFHLKLISSI
jgi:hypothetical protein